MILLHIEHPVVDFDGWKASFDNFAELRHKSGVRRFRVSRLVNDSNVAMIELEFDTLREAKSLLAAVQEVWKRVNGTLIHNPQWRFSELVESKELQR